MSIGKAVRDLIEARGLRPAEVADRLGGKRNRATFYRLLSGETSDPRVSTLLEICNSLTTSPSELLQLAGLLAYQERSLELIDVELRQAFGELQRLNDDDKRLCLAMLRGVIDLRGRRNESRQRRRASRLLERK
ncbi:MAG TPA: helix-turn-helix transcriptional regulator [Chloroflexota bacterium]|nr:helix-turn-helix transcriptional regulator [Chloroflexota bacterium]